MSSAEAKTSVLVVEDHAPLRDLVATVLNDAGYNVMTAGSGDEALQIAGTNGVDVVVTDLTLPGISGDELIRRLQAESNVLRAVLMSGVEPEALKARNTNAHFLQKPFTPKSLRAAMLLALSDQLR